MARYASYLKTNMIDDSIIALLCWCAILSIRHALVIVSKRLNILS